MNNYSVLVEEPSGNTRVLGTNLNKKDAILILTNSLDTNDNIQFYTIRKDSAHKVFNEM